VTAFAQRFKQLREDSKHWTQDQAAEALGVSRSTIAGYESEEKNRIPREDTLHRMADLFQVSIDYLLGKTDEPRPVHVLAAQLSTNESQGIDEPKSMDDNDKGVSEWDDPEMNVFFKEYKEAPEQRRRELRQFWEFLKLQESGRKPEDPQ